MNEYSVYMHKAPSGRVYIGLSCSPEKRWNKGKGYIKNPYFWRCIKKYGWDNIEHIILYEGLSLKEAKEKEVELISKYKSNNRKYGYNISGGGDDNVSEESRRKMSESRKGNKYSVGRILKQETKDMIARSLKEYYSTHSPTFKGRHHSDETIEKLKARVFSEETKQKMRKNHSNVSGSKNPAAKSVSCYTRDGVFVKNYPFAKMAADELCVDLSSIIKCCRGKVKSCGGYVWKYGAEPGVYGLAEQ